MVDCTTGSMKDLVDIASADMERGARLGAMKTQMSTMVAPDNSAASLAEAASSCVMGDQQIVLKERLAATTELKEAAVGIPTPAAPVAAKPASITPTTQNMARAILTSMSGGKIQTLSPGI